MERHRSSVLLIVVWVWDTTTGNATLRVCVALVVVWVWNTTPGDATGLLCYWLSCECGTRFRRMPIVLCATDCRVSVGHDSGERHCMVLCATGCHVSGVWDWYSSSLLQYLPRSYCMSFHSDSWYAPECIMLISCRNAGLFSLSRTSLSVCRAVTYEKVKSV